ARLYAEDPEKGFLPSTGTGLSFVAARQAFQDLPGAPEVRYPDFAVLLPLRESQKMAPGVQGAFYTIIGIVNAGLGQKGQKSFLPGSEVHRGITLHTARYLPPTEGEMEGRESLPPRFNFSPTVAVVKETLVVGSTSRIVKDLIDGSGGTEAVPAGCRALLQLRGPEIRRILEENREVLVANRMLEAGLKRVAAEREIDGLLALAGTVDGIDLRLDEGANTVGVTLDLGTGGAR
ncbi:MAG: hypothetical protein ACE5JG_05235, partial [Planctomycetota bacterium]